MSLEIFQYLKMRFNPQNYSMNTEEGLKHYFTNESLVNTSEKLADAVLFPTWKETVNKIIPLWEQLKAASFPKESIPTQLREIHTLVSTLELPYKIPIEEEADTPIKLYQEELILTAGQNQILRHFPETYKTLKFILFNDIDRCGKEVKNAIIDRTLFSQPQLFKLLFLYAVVHGRIPAEIIPETPEADILAEMILEKLKKYTIQDLGLLFESLEDADLKKLSYLSRFNDEVANVFLLVLRNWIVPLNERTDWLDQCEIFVSRFQFLKALQFYQNCPIEFIDEKDSALITIFGNWLIATQSNIDVILNSLTSDPLLEIACRAFILSRNHAFFIRSCANFSGRDKSLKVMYESIYTTHCNFKVTDKRNTKIRREQLQFIKIISKEAENQYNLWVNLGNTPSYSLQNARTSGIGAIIAYSIIHQPFCPVLKPKYYSEEGISQRLWVETLDQVQSYSRSFFLIKKCVRWVPDSSTQLSLINIIAEECVLTNSDTSKKLVNFLLVKGRKLAQKQDPTAIVNFGHVIIPLVAQAKELGLFSEKKLNALVKPITKMITQPTRVRHWYNVSLSIRK